MQDRTHIISVDDIEKKVVSAFSRAEQGALDLLELVETAGVLDAEGRKDTAIDLYRLWVAHATSPLVYVAYFNLGTLLSADKDYAQSEGMYRKALEINPNFIQARLNLGNCLEQLKQEDEAIEQWKMVLQNRNIHHPDNRSLLLHALNNLGRLFELKRQFRASYEMLDKSFALDPTQKDVLVHLAHLAQKMCQWPIYKPPKGITKTEMMKGTSPLALLAAFDDPALQQYSAKRFVEDKYLADAGTRVLAPEEGYTHNRLRLGYLSSDFCLHAVSLLIVEMLELHDREQFEVYGFCWSRDDGTALRNRVIKALDHHVKIGDMSDKEAAECIRGHEIDVLIDLHGLTSGARPLILSYRPATVQITYLGFPGTTGLPWIDYVITDKYLFPDELAPYFTEKPLYMPSCFQVSDRKREIGPKPTRAENNLPEDQFVFCSFNNNYKFTPELFTVWMRILKRVPSSVLWLLADNEWSRENLIKEAKKHGIKKERLVFASRVAPPDYLARYQLADLFLDTFPFNGGTTANDALRMNLPLLTLSGRTFASRMAGSLLVNLGLPELIAKDFKDYEEMAVQYANNPGSVVKIKEYLQSNSSSSVFDTSQLTRDIEDLYSEALRNAHTNTTKKRTQMIPSYATDSLKKVLNVGGNSKKIPIPSCFDGWQHDLLDIDPTGNPDLLCDARELKSLAPNQYDAIYCSHNLEHYFWHEVPKVLSGFHWLLKNNGFVFARVPDILSVLTLCYENKLDLDDKLYDSPAGPIHVLDVIYGYRKQIEQSGVEFFAHKTGFSKSILVKLFADCGFKYIFYKCDPLEVTIFAFKDSLRDDVTPFMACLGVSEAKINSK